MSEKKTRLNYIDAAKGIGIILIVIGHAVTNSASTQGISHPRLLEFIAQFWIALFFFLSGLVFSEKHFHSPIKSSFQKIKSLYLPWLAFNLIAACLYNLFSRWGFYPAPRTPFEYLKGILKVFLLQVQPICGAMWFVRALLITSVFFIWLNYILLHLFRLSGRKYTVCLLGLCIFFQVLGIFHLFPTTGNIIDAMRELPFFCLGFLYRKYDIHPILERSKYLLLPAGFAINLLFSFFFTFGLQGKGEFPGCIFYAVTAISGIVMVLSLASIPAITNRRVLLFIGRRTMAIMALHFICFKPVSYLLIRVQHLDLSHMEDIPVVFADFPPVWYFAYVLAGVCIPCILMALYHFIQRKIKRDRG